MIDMEWHVVASTRPNTANGFKDVSSSHLMHNPQQFYVKQSTLWIHLHLLTTENTCNWMILSSGKLKFIRITEHMDSKQSPVSPQFFFCKPNIKIWHFLPRSVLDMYQIFNLKGLAAPGQILILWTSTSLTLVENIKNFISQCFLTGLPFLGCLAQSKIWWLPLAPRTSKPLIKQENIIYDWKELCD